jgi:UDP-N-acetylglucosamine 1-carboxyvinyltransferase
VILSYGTILYPWRQGTKWIVNIGGAKNAVLPILAASIVANDPVTLYNVPKISDIQVMCGILEMV